MLSAGLVGMVGRVLRSASRGLSAFLDTTTGCIVVGPVPAGSISASLDPLTGCIVVGGIS